MGKKKGAKTYSVLVPIAGALRVTCDAGSQADAEALGFELAETALGAMDMKIKTASLQKCVEVDSLEVYEHISEGNVCNVPHSDIEAEELKEE
jgi:hypothetical protein